jgi:hypothetical protein
MRGINSIEREILSYCLTSEPAKIIPRNIHINRLLIRNALILQFNCQCGRCDPNLGAHAIITPLGRWLLTVDVLLTSNYQI